jgi:uncharacterized membrane protein YfcA
MSRSAAGLGISFSRAKDGNGRRERGRLFCTRRKRRPPIAGPVAQGSVMGAILGARILMAVSNERIRLLFIAALLVLAVQMLLAAFGSI